MFTKCGKCGQVLIGGCGWLQCDEQIVLCKSCHNEKKAQEEQ